MGEIAKAVLALTLVDLRNLQRHGWTRKKNNEERDKTSRHGTPLACSGAGVVQAAKKSRREAFLAVAPQVGVNHGRENRSEKQSA